MLLPPSVKTFLPVLAALFPRLSAAVYTTTHDEAVCGCCYTEFCIVVAMSIELDSRLKAGAVPVFKALFRPSLATLWLTMLSSLAN